MNSWRAIDDGFRDVYLNMALDEAVFTRALAEKIPYPTIRFYGFSNPSVTFGYAQNFSNDISRYREEGFSVARRITGGGTVYHESDLTYSLVAPVDCMPDFRSLESSYRIVHEAIAYSFKRFSLDRAS